MWGHTYYEWDKVHFRVNRARTKLQYFHLGIRSKPYWSDIGTIFGLVWALARKEIKELDEDDRRSINNFMKWYLRDQKFKGAFPPFYYPSEDVLEIGADHAAALGMTKGSKTQV